MQIYGRTHGYWGFMAKKYGYSLVCVLVLNGNDDLPQPRFGEDVRRWLATRFIPAVVPVVPRVLPVVRYVMFPLTADAITEEILREAGRWRAVAGVRRVARL